MKATSLLLAASLSLTSLGAMAAAGTPSGALVDYPASVATASGAPALTRAEVKADLAAHPTSLQDLYNYPASVQADNDGPGLSRAAVKAELNQARANGTASIDETHYPLAS